MNTYKKNFRAQQINGESLLELNEPDMLALKLTSPSERAKLILAISQLKAKWTKKQDGGVAEDDSSQIEAIRRSQCVITFGLDGTILDANDNFLKAMGYTLTEVKGRNHSMFVTPEYAASRDYAAFWAKLKAGDYHAAEFKRIGKGGRELCLQATYNPILDANGKPWKVVKYATNVTEQKRPSGDLQFKCTYGEETRVLQAAANVTFEKFSRKIKSTFGHRMNIRYTDNSGDLISVKSDEEFRSMLGSFKDPVIRLQLTRRRREESGSSSSSRVGDTNVLDSMINPVIIINAHGVMQFVNSATSRVFGYSRAEMQDQNVRMLMPPNVAEHHDSYLSEYLRTGIANIIGKGRVIEARRKDGTLLQLELAVSHTRNAKRGDTFTGTFSEVQRMDGPLPNSPQATTAGLSVIFGLLENLLFAAIVADGKGQILFANGHAGCMFGYEKALMVGKNVRTLMPNPDADRHDTYLRNYLETRHPKVIGRSRDVVGMMKDGSLVPLNLTISEQLVNSRPIFTAILRPLSEDAPRTDSKSIMQAEREMLATLAVAGVMIDEKGTIQGFNEAAENLWGWKLTEVVGRNVKILMPNPERDRHDGYLKRYLENGKQRVFGMGRDVTAVHKDGSMLPVRLSVSEKKDESKRIWTAIVQKLN